MFSLSFYDGVRSMTQGRLGAIVLYELMTMRAAFTEPRYKHVIFGLQVGASGLSTCGKGFETASDFPLLPPLEHKSARARVEAHILEETLRRLHVAFGDICAPCAHLLTHHALLHWTTQSRNHHSSAIKVIKHTELPSGQ